MKLVFAAILIAGTGSAFANEPQDAVRNKIVEFSQYCPNEKIQTKIEYVSLPQAIKGVVAHFMAPTCFGQMGENDYLLALVNGQWQLVAEAESGLITANERQIIFDSVPNCRVKHRWDGRQFQSTSENCGKAPKVPPKLDALMRNNIQP